MTQWREIPRTDGQAGEGRSEEAEVETWPGSSERRLDTAAKGK